MKELEQTSSVPLINKLLEDLEACKKISEETPLINPYQQLSYRLLKQLNSKKLSNDMIGHLIADLKVKGFISRAHRASNYLRETEHDKNRQHLTACFYDIAAQKTFAEFQKLVERAIAGIVITAHPTFGFSKNQYDIIAKLIEKSIDEEEAKQEFKKCNVRPDEGLTLEYEFLQSQKALFNLQQAIAELYEIVIAVARKSYPQEWKKIDLKIITSASWVGFDVDGRDDITWMDSVKFRLRMAVKQSELYLKHWQVISNGNKIEEMLSGLRRLFQSALDLIPENPNDIDAVRVLARHMVKDKNPIISCSDILNELDLMIRKTEDEEASKLMIFRGMVSNFRTGFSHIHFRLNAVQLHNAIRPMVALEKEPDDETSRRRFMTIAHKLLDQIEAKTIGYETIVHEQTTAKRLFMIIAQVLKYIDPETPIRFLIAEADTPFTVMAALCYAKLFGVEDKVDISPLFETDQALMRGSEVIEELLENPHYYNYVKKRKRLCIQAGYSDAGRYLGQVAAGLAIERLRIKVIKLWKKFDLKDVELVIFDTGGESVGRGAHPGGFDGRLNYMHSPEARRLVQEGDIAFKQEFSLQGGDGYLWLHTPNLAFATLCRVVENMLSVVDDKPDPFYEDTDWSLDFFLTVKDYNRQISLDPDYMKLISILGTEISYPSGSRMTIRQDEGVASRPLEKLSQIRAIPNNMLLQQLGYLANSLGGVGTAISQDEHGFWKMYKNSARLQHIMTLINTSMNLTDEDFLGAYTSLFRPRYWMHTARYEEESHDHDRMLRLAKMLEKNGVFEGLNRIELTLREDLMYLRDGIKHRKLEGAPYKLNQEEKNNYILLHVTRMALIQKIFLLITRIPRFRDHKGLSVDDLTLRIIRFQISSTLNLLREIFPIDGAYDIDPENPENINFVAADNQGYKYENTQIFDEIEKTYAHIRDISLAISAFIGAFG